MLELTGDLWDFHRRGEWVCITTNGHVGKYGSIMGRGTAFQAKVQFPELPQVIGNLIKKHGNHVHVIEHRKIITFPVKHHWSDLADLLLIERSARELSEISLHPYNVDFIHTAPVFLPRPGCGNGGLNWPDVHPILAKHLSNRFTVVRMD